MSTTTPIRWPAPLCFEQADEVCQCSRRERALRAWAAGTLNVEMTAEQRDSLLKIVGPKNRALSDRELAKAACAADHLRASVTSCFDRLEVNEDLVDDREPTDTGVWDEDRIEYEISRVEVEE
ncbi:hypothetical protein IHQ68_04435 [Chelatococcus sambhunathii]|uniref:Uncharacterized protein n=1 Tax=Chelatococcus sambhunathii TaxID=363953 RepID=A0ABU1DCP2_9HYPH|nr:hypothetical protein [Chelatococcus sambhunathii]MDR4305873.1 hypothetical protein [Chelatococcus sambhunathii]